MSAVIYCRASTDEQDESCDNQQGKCQEKAALLGIKVGRVYTEDGITGSRTDRPAYLEMLEAAQAREFDTLLLWKQSRLGRNSMEVERAMRALETRKVRIVTCNGYDTAAQPLKSRKLTRGITGLIDENYLDELAEDTHRGLENKHTKGFWTGGKPYGYKLVEVFGSEVDAHGHPKRKGVLLEVDQEQAVIVREIFESYANGMSARSIAVELNQRGVPSPGAVNWKKRAERRKGKWLASTISSNPRRQLGILNNELYRGVCWWNRSDWNKDENGRRRYEPRPRSEWKHEKNEDQWRIVDESLWERVRARQKQRQHDIGDAVRRGVNHWRKDKSGHAMRPDGRGRAPKWLLSGLLKCSQCGASMVICGSTSYQCSSYLHGGSSACDSGVRVHRKTAERKLLACLRDELRSPELITLVRNEVNQIAQDQRNKLECNDKTREKRLRELDAEIANILNAIRKGILTDSTKSMLESAEAEKKSLLAASAELTAPVEKIVKMIPRVAEHYLQIVDRFEDRAEQADARDIARIRADLRPVLGTVPVEGVVEAGRLVPYGMVQGVRQTLMRIAVGAKLSYNSMGYNSGSGGRI